MNCKGGAWCGRCVRMLIHACSWQSGWACTLVCMSLICMGLKRRAHAMLVRDTHQAGEAHKARPVQLVLLLHGQLRDGVPDRVQHRSRQRLGQDLRKGPDCFLLAVHLERFGRRQHHHSLQHITQMECARMRCGQAATAVDNASHRVRLQRAQVASPQPAGTAARAATAAATATAATAGGRHNSATAGATADATRADQPLDWIACVCRRHIHLAANEGFVANRTRNDLLALLRDGLRTKSGCDLSDMLRLNLCRYLRG